MVGSTCGFLLFKVHPVDDPDLDRNSRSFLLAGEDYTLCTQTLLVILIHLLFLIHLILSLPHGCGSQVVEMASSLNADLLYK